MTWWGWMIGGAVLFGAELGLVNAQFYLVFVGSAALIVGLLTALIPEISVSAQWAVFGALAVVSMVTFRRRIYGRFHRQGPPVKTGPAGGVLTLPVALAPGASCQAEHGGSYWTVQNGSAAPMPAGSRAHIASVAGLTLIVRPDSQDNAGDSK